MLATLKVLSRRIKQGCSDPTQLGILRYLSKSLLSVLGEHDIHLSTMIWNADLLMLYIQLECIIVVNGHFLERHNNISISSSEPGLPEKPYHAFLAGSVGGYIVWGRYSGVNYQLILYLASRIIVGCIKLASEKGIPPFSWKQLRFNKTYPWAAAGIWGTVMMLFEEYPQVLHPSLRRSMDEIYRFSSSFGSDKL